MKEIIEIINQLRNENSTNGKIAILKGNANNENFKKVLYYTYNNSLQYGFSEKKLRELLANITQLNEITWNNGFDMIEKLASENINNSLRVDVITFLSTKSVEEQDLWIYILTKDLKCGISSKIINKAIPKLIPEFNIQQAYPLDKYPFKKKEWFVLEEKLNGINCSYVNGIMLSRQGKEIINLSHLTKELEQLSFKNYYFNGELVRHNEGELTNGENFRETTSIVNSDAEDKTNIDLIVFDLLPLEEFYDGKSKLKYKDRLNQLKQLKQEAEEKGLVHLYIPKIYYEGDDNTVIDKYLDQATREDKEGLMCIKNGVWKNKRSSTILKVKKFMNADCEIIGYEEGTGRLEGKLGSFIIDYKGNKVNVGSGYTDDERIEFWQHRDDYIGRILQVKFKEQTKDKKTGLVSIQFPIYQCIREIGKEVSYNG